MSKKICSEKSQSSASLTRPVQKLHIANPDYLNLTVRLGVTLGILDIAAPHVVFGAVQGKLGMVKTAITTGMAADFLNRLFVQETLKYERGVNE